ncbi:MAG: zinc ribbon domain-containing protein [Anaerolineae bacterium]|nr:zinc ribbon domain-containing protein [Anaerolineae bacterium]
MFPFNLNVDFQQLVGVIITVVAILAATLTALWISMIIWAYRDMRSRSRDTFAQVMVALLVGVLSVPGLLVYLILRPQETLAEQYERALEEEALLQEIENKQVCAGCGHPTKEDWRLCPYCHTKLKKNCPGCSKLLDLPWTICPYCETPQTEQSQPGRRSAAAAYASSYRTNEIEDI